MATENKTPAPSNTPKSLDFNVVTEKLKQISEHLKTFEGKPGHNPFMYFKQKIQPLVDRFTLKGEKTPEIHKLIMDLPLEAPTVDKLQVTNVGQVPKSK